MLCCQVNYTQLEELYEKYKSEAGGFTILAFPCNQFGAQVMLIF
jgi:glutathione peroxidase-family protein